MLSQNFSDDSLRRNALRKIFLMFLFLRIKKYLLGGDCRHSLTLQACKSLTTACNHCSTQRGARKPLWQYAASKRMHFFIHRFIYVHTSLRAGIIQIYQIQEMGHKSGFVLRFPGSGWYLVSINLSCSFLYFAKSPSIWETAQSRLHSNRLSQSR